MNSDFYCEQVLSGKISVVKVKETSNVLAFHHTNPNWPLHIIVIPKTHYYDLVELIKSNQDLLVELMDVLSIVIDMVQKKYGSCRLTTNFGKAQITKHLHWHVYVDEKMME